MKDKRFKPLNSWTYWTFWALWAHSKTPSFTTHILFLPLQRFWIVKNWLKYILQRSLGFDTYLYVFALFKIRTLQSDSKEKDFFHFLNLLEDGKGDVLDVGANIGIMTVHLAKKVPNSTIHAFEPIPENLSVLTKIISKFNLNKIKVHHTAVGDHEGEVKMILPKNGKTKMQGLKKKELKGM